MTDGRGDETWTHRELCCNAFVVLYISSSTSSYPGSSDYYPYQPLRPSKMAPVQLYVYDLSRGMAKSMSLALTGKQIDGIW